LKFSPWNRFSVSVLIWLLLFGVSAPALQPPEAFPTKGQSPVIKAKQDNPPQRRRIKNRHAIPHEVEILAIRHLQEEDWYNKLEFEIKNVSAKPIYFLLIWLNLKETFGLGGLPIAFYLHYGDMRLYSLEESPDENNGAIQPGEKMILRIPEKQRKEAVEHLVGKGISLDVEDIEISVNMINFGDGTGYVGGASSSWKATPIRRER
jgi:hypothetical protein